MRFLALVVFLALSSVANAQEKEFTLKLNQSDIPVLSEALQAMPYIKVAPLINKLSNQIAVQQQPVQTPAKPETKDDAAK